MLNHCKIISIFKTLYLLIDLFDRKKSSTVEVSGEGDPQISFNHNIVLKKLLNYDQYTPADQGRLSC